jgi:hypothetical protein
MQSPKRYRIVRLGGWFLAQIDLCHLCVLALRQDAGSHPQSLAPPHSAPFAIAKSNARGMLFASLRFAKDTR